MVHDIDGDDAPFSSVRFVCRRAWVSASKVVRPVTRLYSAAQPHNSFCFSGLSVSNAPPNFFCADWASHGSCIRSSVRTTRGDFMRFGVQCTVTGESPHTGYETEDARVDTVERLSQRSLSLGSTAGARSAPSVDGSDRATAVTAAGGGHREDPHRRRRGAPETIRAPDDSVADRWSARL